MQKKSLNYKFKRLTFFDTVLTVLIWVLIIVATLRIAFGITYFRVYVVGPSMSGTLAGASTERSEGGDYVYAFRSSSPKRGDIAIIETNVLDEDGKKKVIIKRVIALGGDTVELKDGVLYLNGVVKEEPYILPENNTPEDNNFPEYKVPEGCMFCLGDNRNKSSDSRSPVFRNLKVNWTVGIVADWSMSMKGAVTAFNTFFDFTVPEMFGVRK